jgi:hypothetical protein
MNRPLYTLALTASLVIAATQVQADDSAPKPVPSKHQLMKNCMAKQKASDGGMPKEDMKKNCKDVTQTEEQNDKVEHAAEQSADAPKN